MCQGELSAVIAQLILSVFETGGSAREELKNPGRKKICKTVLTIRGDVILIDNVM